jgi:hypothetical protein
MTRVANKRTRSRLSKASQSPVPVGSKPMDLHFHRPTPSVKRLHRKYSSFCASRVENAAESDLAGAKGLKADSRFSAFRSGTCKSAVLPEFMVVRFLTGVRSNMKTMPILKICTPPPDIYNIKACIGSDFAGESAKSHAFLSFILS